jgi:segregation and condensation protein A
MTENNQEQPSIEQNNSETFATVLGDKLLELPKDLYIPPDALEVFLEAFEGPLDLLLYLIKKQNLDILDIPIAKITEQYMEYIGLMEGLRFELAAEYLVMAASLAEIKSRMLLPRPESEEGDEDDPRAELIRRLQEYERFKTVAENINELPRMERDTTQANAVLPKLELDHPEPVVELKDLLFAFQEVLRRVQHTGHHQIQLEPLSVRERMAGILDMLRENDFVEFHQLFTFEEGRMGVVVSFIAVLELMKGSVVDIVQSEPLSPIHVKMRLVSVAT